ncbi:methenyltetrahydromethanopterin cyclohydrolase [Rhodoligotrophos appendicifer]|uniref:methenyltetrahydromethanopterin cyclohydrolase n=1 Tax=Rhodoligotrophos appendicifer TaxID=987056 RepID=UPI0011868BC0|nr:methenyltetrahydromethanopterin cyclohydrolase [Rhodoligotrophos appendicifer]
MTILSVNAKALRLVDKMVRDAAELRISVTTGPLGERLIDAGAAVAGGIEAGLHLARICMGGLGTVSAAADRGPDSWPWSVVVRSSLPVIACLGSQYAGWSLHHGDGGDAYFALGSGPARALAHKEALFDEVAYRDQADHGVLVLETDTAPPPVIVEKVAEDCGIPPSNLTFIYAPTRSLAGTIQVVARVLEVALHKAHAVHFPLERILDGLGTAPISPPHPDFVTALGRTNDAIIYGGHVHLFVSGSKEDAEGLAQALPSAGSRDFGAPFAEIFKRFNGDFYAIDPLLFSPAEVIVTAVDHGASFHSGARSRDLLDKSFR